MLFFIWLIFFTMPGLTQPISDFSASYSLVRISEANLESGFQEPEYIRHFLEFQFGKGPMTMGIQYQRATTSDTTDSGNAETGLMAIAGYDLVLSSFLRLESFLRIGILSETDPSQPLYATDTDLRLNLVLFNEDGSGWLAGGAFFPSLYAGGILNRYGRAQIIGGAGCWWKNISVYFTALHSFNGVRDPSNPGSDADIVFANLQESAVSFSISYEFRDFRILLKQNQPIRNGGNDLAFTAGYQLYFD